MGCTAVELSVPSSALHCLVENPSHSLRDSLVADQVAILCNTRGIVVWYSLVRVVMQPNLIIPVGHALVMSRSEGSTPMDGGSSHSVWLLPYLSIMRIAVDGDTDVRPVTISTGT